MFAPETTDFLNALAQNNNRDWFHANKSTYETWVKTPAKFFSAQLSEQLSKAYGIKTKPKVFRINRDLRFSKDKTPYNTHIHMSFADSEANAAWMVGLQRDRLVLGYGCFGFHKDAFLDWRAAVAAQNGGALSQLLVDLGKSGCRIEDPELKRVPAPYPSDHPRADLLKRKSIAVWYDGLSLSDVYGDDAPVRLLGQLERFSPLRNWMAESL